jgi:hypothetical protein
MNLATLSASYLRARPLNTALSLLLLALGVGTIVLLVLVVSQLEERMNRDARGIDLVVGAKGSPMQLILSGIYHVDAPTGNIPLAAAQALAKHRLNQRVIPLALGDGWKGFRVVGAKMSIRSTMVRSRSWAACGTSRWKWCSAPRSRRAPALASARVSPARTVSPVRAKSMARHPTTWWEFWAVPAACSTDWYSPASRASGRCTR